MDRTVRQLDKSDRPLSGFDDEVNIADVNPTIEDDSFRQSGGPSNRFEVLRERRNSRHTTSHCHNWECGSARYSAERQLRNPRLLKTARLLTAPAGRPCSELGFQAASHTLLRIFAAIAALSCGKKRP
jgi:hypothetical protein